jgi:Rod binding domain-containing protein
MMASSSSSSNGFGLAEKIARQLLHDSEDLDRSVRDFQETRTRGLQMQYDAYAAYEEEIKAIGYINEGLEIEDDDDVDHNMARILNTDMAYAKEDDDDDKAASEGRGDTGWDKILNQPRKAVKKSYLQEEKQAVPSIKEKKDMREKLFAYLDENRITEMRQELTLEMAIAHEDEPAKIERLQAALFETQKENAQSLRDFMDVYQANPTGRLWGNGT